MSFAFLALILWLEPIRLVSCTHRQQDRHRLANLEGMLRKTREELMMLMDGGGLSGEMYKNRCEWS